MSNIEVGVRGNSNHYLFGESLNYFSPFFELNFKDTHQKQFNHYLLDYPLMPSVASDYRNRYIDDRPDRSFSYEAGFSIPYSLTSHCQIIPQYTFSQKFSQHDYALYRLDRIAGFGQDGDAPLELLPSTAEYEQAIDLENSFNRKQRETSHSWNIVVRCGGYKEKCIPLITLTLPLTQTNRTMDYRRADYNARTHQRTLFFEPQLKLFWNLKRGQINFIYRLHGDAPDMARLIEIPLTEDPLNITYGNAALKNTFNHKFFLNIADYNSQKQRDFNLWASYNITRNALAMGCIYNRKTGVRTFRPENVEGNRHFDISAEYSSPLDSKRRLTITAKPNLQIDRSVDLITETSATQSITDPVRSIVYTQYVSGNVILDYTIGSTRISMNGNLGYNHSYSYRENFTPQTIWSFNYGPTLKTTLLWNTELSTNLSMYGHYGFSDSQMNKNELVWNARLTYSLSKRHLTFILDGFDILHSLSNKTFIMNSQGRVESWTNTLPSYLLAHIVYHFSKNPEKRK